MKSKSLTYQKLLKKYHKQKAKVARLKKQNHLLLESAWVLRAKLTEVEQELAELDELCGDSADHITYLNLQISALNAKLCELGVDNESTSDDMVQDYIKKARQKRDETSKLRAMQHIQEISTDDEETIQ